MKFELEGNPDYGDLVVELDAGEEILSESGAMSRMSGGIDLKSRMMGGFGKALIRKLVGGESLFCAEYSAKGPARVAFSPKLPGTVFHRRIENDRFFLTGGSFLACTPGINLDMRFGGLKAFFSSEGAFFIEVSGTGDVFYNSFGAVVEREVDGSLLVDNGHLVAWEPTLDWKLTSSGGVKQTLFSGEGLLMRFEGRGKVLLQSRHLASLANWLRPYCK